MACVGGGTGGIDDLAAVALLDHLLGRRLGAPQDSLDVDGVEPVEGLPVIARMRSTCTIPALETIKSRRPRSATVFSTMATTWSRLLTSAGTAVAVAPLDRNASAEASALLLFTSLTGGVLG